MVPFIVFSLLFGLALRNQINKTGDVGFAVLTSALKR